VVIFVAMLTVNSSTACHSYTCVLALFGDLTLRHIIPGLEYG
jgi:hypothetical protein